MSKGAGRPRRETAQAAAAAAEDNSGAPSEMTLSNGIVLTLRPIPPGIIERAVGNLKKPQPPKIKPFKDKDIEEENPDDPEYQAALATHQSKALETGTNVLLIVGTQIKSIPDGLLGPEENGWFDADLMAYLGVEVLLDTKYDRYLSWLELYALASQTDVLKVLAAVTRRAGVGEEDTKAAVARFRGRKARRTD